MQVRLLPPAEIEGILRRPAVAFRRSADEIALCTVMDILEVAERSRKAAGMIDLGDFLKGWAEVQRPDGPVGRADIQVAALNQEDLAEALFSRDQSGVVRGLWGSAVGSELPPDRTVRRLILRPSEHRWWGGEAYEEMESRYGEASHHVDA
jgi:hypothetical protein